MTPPTWPTPTAAQSGARLLDVRPRGCTHSGDSQSNIVDDADSEADRHEAQADSRGERVESDGAGRRARVSRAYVFRLEAGGSDPTVGVLQRLAKTLGVPVTALLE